MQKKSDKIKHPFLIKPLIKLELEEMCLTIIKTIYDKLSSQHNTKWEKAETISYNVRNKTRMSSVPTLTQHNFGIPTQSNKIRARNKRDSDREGRTQTIPIFR
jgi:hypothetical protein